MILSKPDLIQTIKKKQIAFDPPIEDNQIGEASVDLRLGFSFTKFKDSKEIGSLTLSVAEGLAAVGDLGIWITKELKEKDEFGKPERFTLGPKEFVLAFTYERISVPSNLIGLIEGRSTYARVGLSMHQTAPWIQPGWNGPVVLEIMNHGPIRIDLTPIVDRPCQLSFFQLTKRLPPKALYGARPTDVYQDQKHPLRHKKKP